MSQLKIPNLANILSPNALWTRRLSIILALAFAVTVSAHGVPTPIGVVTLPSLALIVGLTVTIFSRFAAGRPIIPTAVLLVPVVFASLAYFAIGLCSGFIVQDTFLWGKEVMQRTIIILLPMFMFSLTPRKPEDLKLAILSYLPLCLIVVLFGVHDVQQNGLAEGAYSLGMHKNQIAGSCSVMSTIAIAALLTSNRPMFKRIMLFFAVGGGVGCLTSQGKAGMVCIIIASIVMFIAARTKPRYIVYFALTWIIAGALMWKILPEKARDHVISTKKYSTNEIRLTLWSDVLPVLVKDPWLAVGWGNPLIRNTGTEERFFGDCANVLLFDWMQLTPIGPLALLAVIFLAIKQGLDNARRIPTKSLLSFINLVALGVVCGRFSHAMVDTFWIGRGVTLTAWAAIGMLVFVKLYIDQTLKQTQQGQSLEKRASLPNRARTPVLR